MFSGRYNYAIAYAILRLADAQQETAKALEALEPIANDLRRIASALDTIADRGN
jgi:hypothetical protein